MNDSSLGEPLAVDFDALEAVACPCGEARRAFLDNPEVPFSLHRTQISANAVAHYHKRTTETYYFLKCDEGAKMELDGELIEVKANMAIHVPAGVMHRAVGEMEVLILALPKFDSADEWFE